MMMAAIMVVKGAPRSSKSQINRMRRNQFDAVPEFGLPNPTMHKTGEVVALADLDVLARIYARIALAALRAG